MRNLIYVLLLILFSSCSVLNQSECEKAFTDEMNERCLKVIKAFAKNPDLAFSADTTIFGIHYIIASDSPFQHDQEQFNAIISTFKVLNKYDYKIGTPYVRYSEWQKGFFDCQIIYPIFANHKEWIVDFNFGTNDGIVYLLGLLGAYEKQ